MKQILLCLPLLVILAACGGESQATTPAPIAKPTPTVAPPHFYNVGETVTSGPWEMTLRSTKLVDPTSFSQYQERFPWLKPGDRFLVLDQHLKNISAKTQTMPGMQFVLKDKDGNSNFSVTDLPDTDTSSIGGEAAPTMELSGQRVYVLPGDVHLLYWIYFDQESDNQVIWQINV